MRADRPIRVAHVTTVPMSLIFLRGQAAFMRARGIELSFVSSPGPALDELGEREGARTHAVPMERRITPFRDLIALARLYKYFRENKPDIVHAHTPKGGLLGTLAATFARVPVRIYHMRGLPLMGASGSKRVLLSMSERVSCRLATEVLCVSRSLREVAIELGLVDSRRIRVLGGGSGQGVDAGHRFDPRRVGEAARRACRHELGIDSGALVFGFVGRVVRDKGIHELAGAWERVREELPDAHLVIVGPFESEDPISPAVRDQLERDPRVHIVGPTHETPRMYAAIDVVILPTYREGFPNVPLEAAAMERPVIATKIPGCVDAVVDGVTGTLVPAKDAGALAEAMLRYRDPDLRERHGTAGRRNVLACFAQETIWRALAETYERQVSRGVSTGRAIGAVGLTRA